MPRMARVIIPEGVKTWVASPCFQTQLPQDCAAGLEGWRLADVGQEGIPGQLDLRQEDQQ